MSIQPNDPTYGEETAREQALSILMVASEAMPYVKTGGLADVTGALTTTTYEAESDTITRSVGS